MKAARIFIAVLLGLALILGVAAFSGGRPFGGGMGGGRGCGMMGALNLTPDQAGKLFDLKEKFRTDTAQVRKQMVVKRAELRALWKAENPDEKAIVANQKELNALQGQMIEKRVALKLEARTIAPQLAKDHGMGWGMRHGRGMGHGGGRGCGMMGALNLTPDQAGKLFDLKEKFRTDTAQVHKQMLVKRVELRDLWKAENPDEKAIDAKQKELNALQGQMIGKQTALRLEARKVAPQLAQGRGMGRGMGPGGGMGAGVCPVGGPCVAPGPAAPAPAPAPAK